VWPRVTWKIREKRPTYVYGTRHVLFMKRDPMIKTAGGRHEWPLVTCNIRGDLHTCMKRDIYIYIERKKDVKISHIYTERKS